MSSRAAALVCAVGLVVVLVGDGITVALRMGRSGSRPTPSALERVLPDLESFVERERGLRFRRPVRVELQSDARFAAALRRLRATSRRPRPPTTVVVGLFRALGLVEGRFDPSALGSSTDEQVLGFYDSGRERLLVRGDHPTPAVRRVLVHELTHALDDQHFDLDRAAIERRDDESAKAFAALVEGDAVRVESRYFDSLSAEEQRSADLEAEAEGQAPADLPRIFEVLLSFPYTAGRSFVEALVEAGGTARVDAAFAHPPATTEEVLHPDRYLAGDKAPAVSDPTAEGSVIDRGVLGELLLRLVLQETLDRAVANKAADGWGGDRYVAWSDGDRTCVRDRLVMDTPGDRTELVAALRQWAGSRPGATIGDGNPVTVTRCG